MCVCVCVCVCVCMCVRTSAYIYMHMYPKVLNFQPVLVSSAQPSHSLLNYYLLGFEQSMPHIFPDI